MEWLSHFWRELKRRNVIHIITVYAAIAFVILQLVDIVAEPLQLPGWIEAFVIVILCIGFIITFFISWIYDLTPTGIIRTKPVGKTRAKSPARQKVATGWKIATFISAVIIISLVVLRFNQRGFTDKDLYDLEKSIAVLPFINDSPGDSNQYFINGIMEEVLNKLQKIKDFRVLSRTSTARYTEANRPTLPEIAEKLKVNYIVEGSGQKYGNTFTLRVQLIAAGKEKHLWGSSFEQEINEVSDYTRIQSQIAQSIATELKATISPEEKQILERSPTSDLTALDFYQRGKDETIKYWLDQNDNKSLENAIRYFKLALKSDSSFALAYTGIAFARLQIYWNGVIANVKFSENDLKLVNDSIANLIDKALYYNNNLDEAYFVKGLCSMDYEAAIKEYRRALKINPSYGLAYNGLAEALYYGRDEGINSLKNKLTAIELERGPLLPEFLRQLGTWFEFYGFNENAIDLYKQTFQLTNDTLRYYQNMSGPYFADQNWEESIMWANKILEHDPGNDWAHSQLAHIYSFLGNFELLDYHAGKIIESDHPGLYTHQAELYKGIILWKQGNILEANEIFDKHIGFLQFMSDSYLATDYIFSVLSKIYAVKGDRNKAIGFLKKIRNPWGREKWFLGDMENSPFYESIRSDEQFKKILETKKSEWQKEHEKVRRWMEENNMLKN